MIGKEVTFTVLDVKGNQVRVGIDAPRKIPVHRGEIYKLIQRNKKAAPAESEPVANYETLKPFAP